MDPSTNTQSNFNANIQSVIAALAGHLANLGKSTASHVADGADAQHGLRIANFAGTNNGATMKSDGQNVIDGNGGMSLLGHGDEAERAPIEAYANSNYQAVNNSVLYGGAYTAGEPGVHLDIADYAGEDGATGEETEGEENATPEEERPPHDD